MRRTISLVMMTALVCTALGAATPLAHSSPNVKPKLGKCWVGTWRDGHERDSTNFDGQHIRLHYSGGDIDHFFADGIDRDNWNPSHIEHGTFQGSTITVTIRGTRTTHLHVLGPHKYRVTSGGWSKTSSYTINYQGHSYPGRFDPVKPFTVRYSCSATTLKYYTKKGKLEGQETLISHKP